MTRGEVGWLILAGVLMGSGLALLIAFLRPA